MKLSIELDKKLNIMTKYALNAEEWLFIELLFLATEDEPHPQYMYKYFTECAKKSLPRDTLQSLKDKNILAKTYKIPKEGEDFDLEVIEWNQTFKKYYFKESQEAGMELWQEYPSFLQINNGDEVCLSVL